MKNKIEITELIQNFDYEFDNTADCWNVHINMLYNEVNEVRLAFKIFKTVEKEWEIRAGEKRVTYSAIRTILYESLPYRIIMGLSKILVGKDGGALLRAINVISQLAEFNADVNVKAVIKKIRCYLDDNNLVSVIATYRDKFFAHLDEEAVHSDCRIDVTVAMKDISETAISEVVQLVEELYEACFKVKLSYKDDLSEADIIHTFFWMGEK